METFGLKHAWMLMSSLALVLCVGPATRGDGGADQPKRPRSREEMRRRMMRDDGAPKVGEAAHLFKLKTVDGKREVNLKSFSGKRPVLLFFGSYT